MSAIVENRGREMVREREVEIAVALLEIGDPIEKIATVTKLPLETIQELADKVKPATA